MQPLPSSADDSIAVYVLHSHSTVVFALKPLVAAPYTLVQLGGRCRPRSNEVLICRRLVNVVRTSATRRAPRRPSACKRASPTAEVPVPLEVPNSTCNILPEPLGQRCAARAPTAERQLSEGLFSAWGIRCVTEASAAPSREMAIIIKAAGVGNLTDGLARVRQRAASEKTRGMIHRTWQKVLRQNRRLPTSHGRPLK
jgi:hypothetical protein